MHRQHDILVTLCYLMVLIKSHYPSTSSRTVVLCVKI